jgi:2'-5' RNA ligase
MRTFIAISLPPEIQNSLAKLQQQLKTSGADIKWVEPQNIHLTLKFLGERDDKKIEKVMLILEDAAKGKKQFKLRLSTIGAFPRISSPRVIWVGASEGDIETKAIAQELEEKIAKIGIPKEERAFSCHITIGRARSAKNIGNLIKELSGLADKFGQETTEFTVNKITLYKSTLTSKSPIYEVLKEASLKTS